MSGPADQRQQAIEIIAETLAGRWEPTGPFSPTVAALGIFDALLASGVVVPKAERRSDELTCSHCGGTGLICIQPDSPSSGVSVEKGDE